MTVEYIELSEFKKFQKQVKEAFLTRTEYIKNLEARVAALEAALMEKKPAAVSTERPTTDVILQTVAGSRGLKEASEKLGISEASLKSALEPFEKFKYYGELWNRAAKRAQGIEVPPQKTPENISVRSPRSWAAEIKSKGLQETAKEAGVNAASLGMYLHMEGFKVHAGKVSAEEWKAAASRFLENTP